MLDLSLHWPVSNLISQLQRARPSLITTESTEKLCVRQATLILFLSLAHVEGKRSIE